MKILGIDSSAMVATVAVVQDNILLAEYTINHKKTHSQTLLPMIDEVKKMIELEMDSLDAIAITNGPGSYTGLRIGAATAKGFGLALDIPIVSIPTTYALAYNMYSSKYVICPIMDARRKQVYTGIYEFKDEELEVIMDQKVMLIDELIDELNQLDREVIFLGDAVEILKEEIESKINIPHHYAPAMMNRSRAASVASLGEKYYKEGKTVSADDFKLNYLRLSQAERELKEKNKIKDKNISLTHKETDCGKLTIKELEEEDLEQVEKLEKECFSTPWSLNSLKESAKKDNTIFLVGKLDEKVIGYCGIYLAADEGDITNVAVTKNYRKNKVALSLLQELHTRAVDKGAKKIALEVRQSNTAAIKLYEKMNYRICSTRKDYYDNPTEDAYIMTVEL